MLIKRLLTLFLLLALRPSWGAFGFSVPSENLATTTLSNEAVQVESNELKVLVWNVYKFGKDRLPLDYKNIITRWEPNLLMIQESVAPKGESYCLLTSDCYFSSAFHKNDIHYGVMTSSRFPVSESYTLHSDLTEPFLNTPKASLVTTLETEQGQVLVINTHGINFVSLMAYDIQLREVVEKAKDWQGPIIWAGDFNSWNPGRQHLLAQATQALGLKDVLWMNDGLIKRFMGFKLDHVFHRGLSIKRAQVFRTKGSDHNALYFEAKIEE